MPRESVLIVEDDPMLSNRLANSLRRHCKVDQATTYSGAQSAILEHHGHPYDLIILDRMLQNDDGLDLLPLISSDYPFTKVFILSACDSALDRVRGLSYGADDYLVKPFSMAELQLRVQNLLHRGIAFRSPQVHYYDLCLQEDNRLLLRGGRHIRLTGQQVSYLRLFMTQPSGIANSQNLAHLSTTPTSDIPIGAVHVNVQRLRRKLETIGATIASHYGLGYQLILTSAEKPL
jgi:DNA-binding response OmpR family regulator